MIASFVLVPKLRTPRINPGNSIEIEVFITGSGLIKQNKLYISWSLPYLINASDPGVLECCIKIAKDSTTGKMSPLSGSKYLEAFKLSPIGATVVLNEGNFMDIPKQSGPPNALPRIMCENMWDGLSPLLLKVNTSPKARPGDYEITLVLMYFDGTNIQADQKNVVVHVKDWIERNPIAIPIIGIIISVILGVPGIVSLFRLLGWF